MKYGAERVFYFTKSIVVAVETTTSAVSELVELSRQKITKIYKVFFATDVRNQATKILA